MVRQPCCSLAIAALATLVGCQYVAGIDSRQERAPRAIDTTDGGTPPTPDAGTPPAPDAGPPAGCVLPTKGEAHLRFGNMSPGIDAVHFCVKPAHQATFAPDHPLTLGVGADCPAGIPYQRMMAPLAVAPGTYTIKLVDADTVDCSADGLAVADDVAVAKGQTVTLLRLAGEDGEGAPSVRAFPETKVSVLGTSLVRFIHAMVGVGKVDVGTPDVAGALGPVGFANVPYGGVAPQGATGNIAPVDDRGYLPLWTNNAWLQFVLAAHGQTTTTATRFAQVLDGTGLSLIGVGDLNDADFPPQIIACQESVTDGVWTECAPSAAQLSVMVFEPMLDGAGAAGIRQRRPYVPQAIAASDADVLCVPNVCSVDDKQAIIDAATDAYPYAYHVIQDLSTPLDDATDVHGVVPAPLGGPACRTDEQIARMNAGIACVQQHCSQNPGDPHSEVASAQCAEQNCVAQFGSLMWSSDLQDRICYNCIAFDLVGFVPLARLAGDCTTNTTEMLAYGGNNCQLVLSRHPFEETETWTVAASSYRTSFSRVRVSLPNQTSPDVYCTVLTTAERALALMPYTSVYGEGDDPNGWTNENRLQIDKLEAFVTARSGIRPAIVMGAFYVGPERDLGDTQILAPKAVANFDALRARFGLGVAPEWPWDCTECADNRWKSNPGSGPGTWTTHIFLNAIPVTDVLARPRPKRVAGQRAGA